MHNDADAKHTWVCALQSSVFYSHKLVIKFYLDEVPPAYVAIASFCLTLPGKNLHLSSLLQSEKFCNKGNKEGALAAFQQLQSAGLGKFKMNGTAT